MISAVQSYDPFAPMFRVQSLPMYAKHVWLPDRQHDLDPTARRRVRRRGWLRHHRQEGQRAHAILWQPVARIATPLEDRVGVDVISQRLTWDTEAPGAQVFTTIRHLSSSDQNRRVRRATAKPPPIVDTIDLWIIPSKTAALHEPTARAVRPEGRKHVRANHLMKRNSVQYSGIFFLDKRFNPAFQIIERALSRERIFAPGILLKGRERKGLTGPSWVTH